MFNPFAAISKDKRIPLVLAATLLASIAVFLSTTVGGTQNQANEERKLKTKDFHDMPLVVLEVRNLKSDTWYKDLEIEVKNVSKKPIYFILAYLKFPDIPVPGDAVYGTTMAFGVRRNINYERDAVPQDPRLNPGDKFTFRIPEDRREGLRRAHEKSSELMKKLELNFGVISFGDGTGFVAGRLLDRRRKYSHPRAKQNHRSARIREPTSVVPPPQDGCGSCSRYVMDEDPYVICYSSTNQPCDSYLAITSPNQPCTLKREVPFDCGGVNCYDEEICDLSRLLTNAYPHADSRALAFTDMQPCHQA